ncbi:4-carboxymuconolactone decarboxylase [Nocardioides sp.]|nr:4-carboxymuconolactone decarboxylase [Nocardioides sp.]THJ04331.1 4-carboxymuconolactone decarboxylase [Nocardioides sp.]
MTPLTAVHLGGREDLPLLVLGPSLGTTASDLWSAAADQLVEDFRVIAWDLPGHGTNRVPVDPRVTMADLAAGVLGLVDSLRSRAAGDPPTFHYAGDSVGGAVGIQLLLDAPSSIRSATLICTGASIGSPEAWRERSAMVRAEGTAALADGSAARWFAPDYLNREPATAAALVQTLADIDDEGYSAVCGALAEFDVRDRLGDVVTPVLAVAGAHDTPTPPDKLREIAEGVRQGRLVVLDDVAHLAPVEDPARVARLIRDHALRAERGSRTSSQVRATGMVVRRQVLGDEHVDRSVQRTTDLTRDFQELITEYAWGSIWTRPGLDRRSRSMVTLTALVAGAHHDELAMHLRAALRNGLSIEEIKEVLLQTAIYCGVPAANTAFRIAQEVLEES